MSVDHFFDGLMVMGPRSADGGKSAYAYAVEGGYTGTETEFAKRLAFLMNGAVVGYMEDSTIILSGNLAPGTYTFAYVVPRADGTDETAIIGTYTVEEEPEPTTYTVTFVADGVTVDAVEYQEGDTALERVPAVPAKDGYTGVWETYDISNGGNITVNAVYTQIPVTPTYTNLFTAETALLNTRIAGTGELKTDTNATGKVTTDFITIPSDKLPFEATTKIYIKGATFTADGNTKIATYQAATGTDYSAMYSGLNGSSISTVDEGNGVISVSGLTNSFPASVKRMALTLKVKDTAITADDVAGIVITIGEPIS